MRNPQRLLLSLFALVLVLAAVSPAAFGEWIALGGEDGDPVGVRVLESGERIVLEYTLPGFFLDRVKIGDRECVAISVEGAIPEKIAGMPELPKVNRGIIIPDRSRMVYRIVDAEYTTLEKVTVVPSKGHLSREIDPADVPYVFGPVYGQDVWDPKEEVVLHDPYILRDYRGMIVEFRPFRFNPVRETMRICTRLVLEISSSGEGGANIKDRVADYVSGDFASTYARRFINYGFASQRYVQVAEPGRLCIVVYDAWVANIQPLVDWKSKKGIETVVVTKSAAGGTAAAIKSYLQGLYNSPEGLTYAILIGDSAQIPYFTGGMEGAACDSIYARLEGNDLYPDIYVSRLSAQTPAQVDDQVDKFLSYERNPSTTDAWVREGVAIASNEGNPTDAQRMDAQFVQLEGYGYTNTCKQYQGTGGSTSGIATCLNQGRGILGYYGHGSGTSWGSVYFGNENVDALTNANQIPWIFEASCLNGNLALSTCFAEAWLRATSGGEPSGAIACYMGSTNESWDPPVYGCEEAVDVFTAEEKNSCGGVYYSGSMYVCDLYPGTGTEGERYMDQCILFGDASLQLRSKLAVAPVVTHPAGVPMGPSLVEILVTASGSPVMGALVCVRQAGFFTASATTGANGRAYLDIFPGSADPVDVTVTGYNLVPYEGTMQPISEGPYVTYLGHVFDDDTIGGTAGNGDGVANPTEVLGLELTLKNYGNTDADGVTATITTTDPYLTIQDGSASYGTIPAQGTGVNLDPMVFEVAHGAPHGHLATLHVTVQNATRGEIGFDIEVSIVGPVVSFVAHTVDDFPNGNADGDADMGETVYLEVELANPGSLDLTGVTATITTLDPTYVTLVEDTALFTDIAVGGTGTTLPPHFRFHVSPDTPCGSNLAFQIAVNATEGIASDGFEVTVGGTGVGFDDDMESGVGEWTHSGTQDTWSLITYGGSHSPTHSWQADATSGISDQYLRTPEFNVTALSEMSFWHTYEVEPGWDGCVIEISTNGGSTWVDLGPYITQGGYDTTLHTGYGCPLEGREAWSGGNLGTMTQVKVNLATFQGHPAQVRFRLATDDFYTSYPGWYVDDVVITGAECQPWEDLTLFTCDITTLTPVVAPGEKAYFEVTVANVSGAQQLATVVTNVYRCDGTFYMEHIRKEDLNFNADRVVTRTVGLKTKGQAPASWRNCDIGYEIVVIDASTGVVQCRKTAYFQIQE